MKMIIIIVIFENHRNLAKLDDGLDESPTVMVGNTTKQKLGKNRSILIKHSWAFVEITKAILPFGCKPG